MNYSPEAVIEAEEKMNLLLKKAQTFGITDSARGTLTLLLKTLPETEQLFELRSIIIQITNSPSPKPSFRS